MEVSQLIEQLQADGDRLTSLAGTVDLAANVPTCPDWTVADLLHHLGGVHRWAAGFVRGVGRQPENGDLEQLVGGWPPNDGLAVWFREGHASLVEALLSAPPDLDTWTFMDAPSPLAFWARRQAHETAIHRVIAATAQRHALVHRDRRAGNYLSVLFRNRDVVPTGVGMIDRPTLLSPTIDK